MRSVFVGETQRTRARRRKLLRRKKSKDAIYRNDPPILLFFPFRGETLARLQRPLLAAYFFSPAFRTGYFHPHLFYHSPSATEEHTELKAINLSRAHAAPYSRMYTYAHTCTNARAWALWMRLYIRWRRHEKRRRLRIIDGHFRTRIECAESFSYHGTSFQRSLGRIIVPLVPIVKLEIRGARWAS